MKSTREKNVAGKTAYGCGVLFNTPLPVAYGGIAISHGRHIRQKRNTTSANLATRATN